MTRIFLLSLFGILAFAPASAETECSSAMANWQPVARLVAMAKDIGWTVTKVHVYDGCYHIRATDKNGYNFQAVFDPETLKLLGRRGEDAASQSDHDMPTKGSSN